MKIRALTTILACALAAPAALAQAPTPKNDKNRVCVPCETAVPAAVRSQALAGSTASVFSADECPAACNFKWADGTAVTVRLYCDDDRKEYKKPPAVVKATLIEGVGKGAYSTPRPDGKTARIWDDDTACEIATLWTKPKSDDQVLALAKALVASTTPATLSAKTVEAIVFAVDASGASAKAALARWPDESKALDEVTKLASGHPRAYDLPEAGGRVSKAVLLGECPNTEGKAVVEALGAALPGVRFQRVPASAAAATCPTLTRKPVERGVAIAKVGKNQLGVVASETDFKAVAFLRAPDGKLLDSKVVPLGDEGLDRCRVVLKPGKGSAQVTTECSNPGDLRGRKCKEGSPDRYTFTAQIAAKGAALDVSQSKKVTHGEDCVELP